MRRGQRRGAQRYPPIRVIFFHVLKNLPERIEHDVAVASACIQNIFNFRGVEAAPRRGDYDFEIMSLCQFIVLTIGSAIAGDVHIKLVKAMINQRNSDKGMLVTTVAAAFGDLTNSEESADNLHGIDSSQDEAKK